MAKKQKPTVLPRLDSSFFIVGAVGTVSDGPNYAGGRARGFVTVRADGEVREFYADGRWYIPAADLFAEQHDAEEFRRNIAYMNYGISPEEQPFVPFETQAKFAFNAAQLSSLRLKAIVQPVAVSAEAAKQAGIVGAIEQLDYTEKEQIRSVYPQLFKMPIIDTTVNLEEKEQDDLRFAPNLVDQKIFRVMPRTSYKDLAEGQWQGLRSGEGGFYRSLEPDVLKTMVKMGTDTSYRGLGSLAVQLGDCGPKGQSVLLAIRIVNDDQPMIPYMQQRGTQELVARALIRERLSRKVANQILGRLEKNG